MTDSQCAWAIVIPNIYKQFTDSTVYMYADDTKLYRGIKEGIDHDILQNDLNQLSDWSDLWLLKFHPKNVFR